MSDIEELKKLLKENLEISKKIYDSTEKIKKHFFWARIFKFIKLAVIIGLIIAGFLYSQPYISRIFEIYRGAYQIIFSPASAGNNQASQTNINLDPEQLRRLLDTQIPR